MHRTIIDTPRQPPQTLAKTAELTGQRQATPVAQLQAISDTQATELVRSHLAHAVQFADRQRSNKRFDFVGRDHKQAVGLAPITGDLGQELVRRHPGRHGDVQLLSNPAANIRGNPRCATGKPGAVRDIQVGFVQRQGLDQIGVVAEDRVYFPGCFFIGIHARLYDQQIRAQIEGMPGRHCRTHTIGPRLVVTGGNYPATLSRATDSQRPPGQTRVVTHFNSGVKAIAINMDDLALGHRQP
ncbi:hypothetical protein D3C80_1277990 [compost metagenome]